MSNHQKKNNACVSLFTRFQKFWCGETTASQALELAINSKIVKLEEEIQTLKSVTFADMQMKVVVAEVTPECKRG